MRERDILNTDTKDFFYNEYLNSKSDIVDNSMNLLRNYTEMLSERKDGMQ